MNMDTHAQSAVLSISADQSTRAASSGNQYRRYGTVFRSSVYLVGAGAVPSTTICTMTDKAGWSQEAVIASIINFMIDFGTPGED